MTEFEAASKLSPDDPLRGASPSPEAWEQAARKWGWDRYPSQLRPKPVCSIPALPPDVTFPLDIEALFEPSRLE